jgi:hypothetical protein
VNQPSKLVIIDLASFKKMLLHESIPVPTGIYHMQLQKKKNSKYVEEDILFYGPLICPLNRIEEAEAQCAALNSASLCVSGSYLGILKISFHFVFAVSQY